MMRILSALLFCSAGAAGGLCFYARLTRRVKALEQMLHGFEALRNCVVYLAMPLSQALKSAPYPLNSVHLPLDSEDALYQRLKPSGLDASDVREVFRYLEAMTAMSAEQRAQICDGAIEITSRLHAQAQAKKSKDGSLYIALGVMAGAATGILIL